MGAISTFLAGLTRRQQRPSEFSEWGREVIGRFLPSRCSDDIQMPSNLKKIPIMLYQIRQSLKRCSLSYEESALI